MSFTREELQAMARLSPSQRRAVYSEVYREASRAARVAASEGDGLQDAGMGKSLRKRIKKVVKKVTAPVKRVVDKIEDKVKRVIDKTEETVKRVAKKIPGAEAVSDVGRRIQKVSKRAGGAVQRIAKEAARKAAPVLAIVAPISLSVKSIRKNAAKFYRKHGPLIVTVAGAVLGPFTYGLSAVAAAMIVKGRELYLARNAAVKAQREAKAEAGQMAAAVAQQEAALNAQCDEVYNNPESHESFLMIGLTPERWAGLSVDAKLGIIDSLSKGEMPAGYSLTPEAQAAADEVRRKAQNDELDDLYVKYQAAFESYGYPPDQWYAMTIEQKYAAIDNLTEGASDSMEPPSTEATTAGPIMPAPSAPTVQSPAVVAPPIVTKAPYRVVVEGSDAGVYDSLEAASAAAAQKSSKGDRVEIFSPSGESLGLAIKTGSGLVPVPEDSMAAVRAMSHGELVSKVSQATAAAGGAKTSGGFPWWLVAVPAVLFVGAKAKGA